MEKLLVLTLNYKNGNVFFKDINYDNLGMYKFAICTEHFDDTFIFDDVLEFIEDENIFNIAIICGKECLLFAVRFINTILSKTNNEINAFLISKELTSNTEYTIDDNRFIVFDKLEDINNFDTHIKFQKAMIKYSELEGYYSDSYYDAMNNGIIAALTGVYPNGILGNDKHVFIENANEFLRIQKDLTLNFNSAVVFYNQVFDEELYEKLLSIPGFTCHFHFKYDEVNYTFDNSHMHSNIKRTSLKKYLSISENDDPNFYIVDLEDTDDYIALEKIVDDFFVNGQIKRYNFVISNECRFLGQCLIYKFFRYKIQDDKMYACINNESIIGNITDTKLKKYANIDILRNKRKSTCLAIGEEEKVRYDNLMSKYPYIKEFFLQKTIFRYLKKESETLKETDAVLISNSCFSTVLGGKKKEVIPNESLRIFLYKVNNTFYLFNIKKMVLIRIDPKIALLLEGMLKNVSQEEMIEELENLCNTDKKTAQIIYEQGMKMIRKENVI